MATEKIPNWYSSLSRIQKAYLISLKMSGLEEDELLGFFLLLKEDVPAMEEFILWTDEEHPQREDVSQVLTDYVIKK